MQKFDSSQELLRLNFGLGVDFLKIIGDLLGLACTTSIAPIESLTILLFV